MRRLVLTTSLVSILLVLVLTPYASSEVTPGHRSTPRQTQKSYLMQQSDYYRRQANREPEEQTQALEATVIEEASSLDYIVLIVLVASIVALLLLSKHSQVGSCRT